MASGECDRVSSLCARPHMSQHIHKVHPRLRARKEILPAPISRALALAAAPPPAPPPSLRPSLCGHERELAARVDPQHIGHGAPGVRSREEAARRGLLPTRERPLKRYVQSECIRLEAEHVERKFELVEP